MSSGDRSDSVVEAVDGTPLHVTSAAAMGTSRGTVVLVHGWGEHHGRYGPLTRVLTASGFDVWGYDQRGHGRSGGRRGDAPSFSCLVDDLVRVVRHARVTEEPPLLLLGHSMGGLVTIRALQEKALEPLAACVSAPWLATAEPVPAWKRALARVLLRIYPSLPIPNPLRPERLTRDEAMIRAYRDDPWIHGWMTPRLFHGVEEAQRRALTGTEPLALPILFIVPEADPVVDAGATLHFVRRLGGSAARVLPVPDARHEPFNELDRTACFDEVGRFFNEVVSDRLEKGRPTSGQDGATGAEGA